MRFHIAAFLISVALCGCATEGIDVSSGHDVASANYNAAMEKQGLEHYCGSGKCDVPPSLITATAPTYPIKALLEGRSARVSVLFDIESDGHTSNLRIKSSTSPEFASPSLIAVKNWRFTPAMLNGHAVKMLNCSLLIPFDPR